MKITKSQLPIFLFLGGLLGLIIYGLVSEDIKANKLVNQCNDGKIESCDEVPERKYGLLTNEVWIEDNWYGKYREFRLNKAFKESMKTKPSNENNKIDKTKLIRFCERLIKENLKDPKSYRRITSRDIQEKTGMIVYTATNSFGGRVKETFRCFDPIKVNKQVLP